MSLPLGTGQHCGKHPEVSSEMKLAYEKLYISYQVVFIGLQGEQSLAG